jgi:hypothetical protein
MLYVQHSDLRAAFDGLALLAFFCGFLGALSFAVASWLYRLFLDHISGHVLRPLPPSAVGGMGVPPMSSLSRPTYPTASGGEPLGRVPSFVASPHLNPGPGGRVGKRSDEPRPPSLDQACPASCLKDKRPAGAPALL